MGRRVSPSIAGIANAYHTSYVSGTILNILQILANLILTEAPILKMRKQRRTTVKPLFVRAHRWSVLNVTSYLSGMEHSWLLNLSLITTQITSLKDT